MVLREEARTGQKSEDTPEGRGMRVGPAREILDRSRPVTNEIRKTQASGHVDGLRDVVAGDHPKQDERRRRVVRGHSTSSPVQVIRETCSRIEAMKSPATRVSA